MLTSYIESVKVRSWRQPRSALIPVTYIGSIKFGYADDIAIAYQSNNMSELETILSRDPQVIQTASIPTQSN